MKIISRIFFFFVGVLLAFTLMMPSSFAVSGYCALSNLDGVQFKALTQQGVCDAAAAPYNVVGTYHADVNQCYYTTGGNTGGLTGVLNVCDVPAPPSNCPAAGTNFSSGHFDLGTSDSAVPPSTGCDGGCGTTYSGSGVDSRSLVNGVYHYYSTGFYDHTGVSCTSGTPSPSGGAIPTPTCNTATQTSGTINGVTVCVPKATTTTTSSTTSPTGSTSTTSNPDGSSSTTTSSTTTDTTNNTTTTTTSMTDTKPTPDAFCTTNPTDPSCQVPPSQECIDHPDKVGCSVLDAPSSPDVVPHSSINISFVPTMTAAGSCPTPDHINVGGKQIDLDYTGICTAASTYRPFILAVAMLSALFIVFAPQRV